MFEVQTEVDAMMGRQRRDMIHAQDARGEMLRGCLCLCGRVGALSIEKQ